MMSETNTTEAASMTTAGSNMSTSCRQNVLYVCMLPGISFWVRCFQFYAHAFQLPLFIHLIDLLVKVYRKQLAKVKLAGTQSEWFRVKKGIRQGCVLSP